MKRALIALLACLGLLGLTGCGKSGFVVQKDKGKVIWRKHLIGETLEHELPGADPDTFQETDLLTDSSGSILGKDKDHVYLYYHLIPEADPESFRLLYDNVFCDDDSVYLYSSNENKMKLLKGARPDCFSRFVDHIWSRCGDTFYFYDKVFRPVDPLHFSPQAQFPWARDRYAYYYGHRAVIGADYATFEILEKGNGSFARDKNHYYWKGWLLDEVDYDTFVIEHGGKGFDKDFIYEINERWHGNDREDRYMHVIKTKR